jgi:cytoskeletal protein CcmA (bactofilin family)
MSMIATIGKSIHIKGTVTAEEPLIISGHVEGSITVTGHGLTIASDGHVDADTRAETIVIDGTAAGRLQANERITLRDTATVIGDIVAAALAIAEGATVQGRIESGSRKAAPPHAEPPRRTAVPSAAVA